MKKILKGTNMKCKNILNILLDYLNFTIYRKSTIRSLYTKNELLQNRVDNLRNRLNQTYNEQLIRRKK